MPDFPWIPVSAGAVLTGALIGLTYLLYQRKKKSEMLTEWALTTRPLFNPQERLFFRLLRDALPHHVVLAKMPLIRFCRPVDLAQVRYWHDLLGPIYVTFVVCAPNGRVLAALDVDSEHRSASLRIATIKQEVLQACRIRYVKCSADQFPNVSELQMLVPQQGIAGRAAVPDTVDSVRKVHTTLAHTVRARRLRQTLGAWVDSALGTDSFFSPDSRSDDFLAADAAAGTGSPDVPTEPMPMSMPAPPPGDATQNHEPGLGPKARERPHPDDSLY